MRYLRRNKVNQRRHTRIPGLVDHLAWFNSDKIYTISPVPVLANAETRSQEGDTTGEARESTRSDKAETLNSRGGGKKFVGGHDLSVKSEDCPRCDELRAGKP